jgi:hypothetical protein
MMQLRFALLFLAMIFIVGVSAQETNLPDNDQNVISIESEDVTQGRFEIGEELLLSIVLERTNLGDIFAFTDEAGLYIELYPYLEMAELPIEANTDQSLFSGWFIKEENTFLLDLRNNDSINVSIAGETYYFSKELVKNVDGAVYIHEALFEKWFGIEHEYRFSALRLKLLPTEPLPLQQRLARERRSVRSSKAADPKFPELKRSYGLLSPQTFDLQLGANYQESRDAIFGNYSVLGARDIALVHSNFFFAGNDNDLLANSRLVFSKESIDKDLLGIGAAKVVFGDIQPVRQGLTRNRSRGLLVSNTLVGNTFDKEQINIVGPLQQGWDVELYRDGVLIDRALNVQTGEYSFLDIDLNIGQNNFEIIKYGPLGQIEKEERQRLLDESTINSKDINYSFSLSENDKSLLGTQNIPITGDNGYNFASDINFNALGSNWGFGLQSDFGGDRSQTEISANTTRVINNVFISRAFINANTNDRFNYGVGLSGRLGTQTINAGFSQSSSIANEQTNDRFVASNVNLELSGKLFDDFMGGLNQNTQITYSDNEALTRLSIQNRIGIRSAYGRFFNNIEYLKTETPAQTDYSALGTLTYNKSFGAVLTQLNFGYDLQDEFSINSITGFINYSMSQRLRARLSANHRLDNDSTTTNLNLNYRTGSFNISGNIGHSSLTGWIAGINTTFSISAQPLLYGETFQASRSMVNNGTLSVRVFVDENNNHSYDEGEILVPGVKVVSEQSRSRGITNDMGIAELIGLSHNVRSDVYLDQDSFPDPFLIPIIEGVSITFRRGIADSLDYPVVLTSEIEGTALIKNEAGIDIPATKVPIILLDDKGEIFARQITEYDGYYIFGKVPAGEYSLSIDQDFLVENNIQNIKPTPIFIDPYAGEFVFQDIMIKRKNSVVGYVANIEEFLSQAQLNLYYKLNARKLMPVKHLLAIKDNGNIKQLTSKFFFEEREAIKLCSQLESRNIECQIQQHTHFY